MISSYVVALVLALASPSGGDGAAKRAKSLYGRGRYAEAAAIFDALWRERGESKYLFNAAAAHEAAGHEVAALAAYRHYLHVGEIDERERLEVRVRIGHLQDRLVPVRLAMTPPGLAPSATILAQRGDGDTGVAMDLEWFDDSASEGAGERAIFLGPGGWSLTLTLRPPAAELYEVDPVVSLQVPPAEVAAEAPPIALTATPIVGALTLRLGPEAALLRGVEVHLEDPLGIEAPILATVKEPTFSTTLRSGPWRYSLRPRRRRAEAVLGDVVVSPGGDDVVEHLELETAGGRLLARLRPQSEEERRQRVILGGGLGGAAVVLMGAGAGMMAAANRRLREGGDLTKMECIEDELCGAFVLGASGAGFLGASFGLGAAAVTASVRGTPKVWAVELGVGGALTISGVVWSTLSIRGMMSGALSDTLVWRDRLDKMQGPGFASAGFLGAGIGLLAGAAVGMVVSRSKWGVRDTQLQVMIGGSASGLGLARRF